MKKKQTNPHIGSILICASLAVLLLSNSQGSHYTSLTHSTADDAIDAIVTEEMAKQDIPGMMVGVVKNGELYYTKAYGYKDRLGTQPMTTSTIMRWASISKTVTAVAAFKAIEDKKLTLFDKVTQHAAYWPTTGNKSTITIQQLLSHRSGINHYGKDENGNTICTPDYNAYTAKGNYNPQQSVNVFKNCALAFNPGSDYCYSTFGFSLLGAAIEGATGIPYDKYVTDSIATKGAMSSFAAYTSDPGGYTKDCNLFLKSITEGDVEYKLPGGGWASNITDLAKFMKGLMNNSFLKATLALYVPVVGNNSGNNPDYRYGVNAEMLGTKLHIYHGGAHDDVRTYMGFFPWEKNGVCLMINCGDSVDGTRIAKRIENTLGYTWNVKTAPIDYCGGSSSTNNNCGHTMAAVWRNTGNAGNLLLRRGFKSDEFHQEWIKLLDAGYYADNIETWMDGTVRKWDGIFKKTTKKSAMYRDYSSDAWHDKWTDLSTQGYRLIDLETYLDGTVRKWAGTFIESSDPYYMYRDMSTDEFGVKYKELDEKNIKLINIETYLDGTVRKWAGVWKGNGNTLLNRNYAEEDFKTLRNEREKAGYKLMKIETYVDGTVRKWAGIWEKADGDEHFRLDKKMGDLINNYHNVYKASGFELMDFEKY